MNLQHEFDVPGSPQATLELLLDAERVVPCMPGASLVEVADDGTWKTTMTVKLGPVAMEFANDVRIVENDPSAGKVRLDLSGREKRGRGSAVATVDAQLLPHEGGTRVTMTSDVRFSGQAAQLGRPSVIQDVSTRLVDEFARCLRDRLAESESASETATLQQPPVQKPLSGLSLVAAAVRGAVARLFASRPNPREKGSQ
jgi:carbon monoxide dehydrogenase subunit G